jgi:hypothetical protein
MSFWSLGSAQLWVWSKRKPPDRTARPKIKWGKWSAIGSQRTPKAMPLCYIGLSPRFHRQQLRRLVAGNIIPLVRLWVKNVRVLRWYRAVRGTATFALLTLSIAVGGWLEFQFHNDWKLSMARQEMQTNRSIFGSGSLLSSTDSPKTDTDSISDYSFQSADPSHFESTRPPW